MPERRARTYDAEQSATFVIHDRASGEVLAVHHITALPGVRTQSDRLVKAQVVQCAADALGRAVGDLGVVQAKERLSMAPGLRVDPATGKLRAPKPTRSSGVDSSAVTPRTGTP